MFSFPFLVQFLRISFQTTLSNLFNWNLHQGPRLYFRVYARWNFFHGLSRVTTLAEYFLVLFRVSISVEAREHCSLKRCILTGNIPRQEKSFKGILNFRTSATEKPTNNIHKVTDRHSTHSQRHATDIYRRYIEQRKQKL